MYSDKLYVEFPHNITVERTERIVDDTVYPPKEVVNTSTHDLKAFMDTPSTSQQANYHSLDIRLDRVLYVPYGADITRLDVFIYDGERYEFVGDLQDQGGQHEIVSAPVRRVVNG